MSDLHEIEVTIEECKRAVELAEAMEKLERNSAFKKLILKEYIGEMPSRLTALFASPDERQRKAAELAMGGIGQLETFFNKIRMQGAHAAQALEELEKTKLEVMAEE